MTKVPIMREPVVEGEILPPNDPPPQVPPKPTTKGYTLDELTRRRGESEADFIRRLPSLIGPSAALLVRHYPSLHTRHEAALVLGGVLARGDAEAGEIDSEEHHGRSADGCDFWSNEISAPEAARARSGDQTSPSNK